MSATVLRTDGYVCLPTVIFDMMKTVFQKNVEDSYGEDLRVVVIVWVRSKFGVVDVGNVQETSLL